MPPKKSKRPTQAEKRKAGMIILRTVEDEVSVMQTTPKSTFASNVPDAAATDIDKYIKQSKGHELYGSLAMRSRNFSARTPEDIDIAVRNPTRVAHDLKRIIERKGKKAKITTNPQWKSHVVQVKKGDEFVDAIDIHPIDGHTPDQYDVYGAPKKPRRIAGINTQTAADQLLRKANSVMAKGGPAPKRAKKDTVDFITTARVLLDSKQLQAEAEMQRVKTGRKALKVWEREANALGATGYRKDPIPERREREFISFAGDNPKADVDNIKLGRRGVSVKKLQPKFPDIDDPSPKQKKQLSQPKRKGKMFDTDSFIRPPAPPAEQGHDRYGMANDPESMREHRDKAVRTWI